MSSLLYEIDANGNKKEIGLMSPAPIYALTNVSDEEFVGIWNSEVYLRLQPGETSEPLPLYLANKFVDELVNKIMIKGIKAAKDEMRKNNPNDHYTEPPNAMSLGVPAARKVWEDKIVKKIDVDLNSPRFKVAAGQLKQEIEADMARAKEPVGNSPTLNAGLGEFAQLAAEENLPGGIVKPKSKK